LAEALTGYAVTSLRQMALHHGLDAGLKKARMVRVLAAHFSSEEHRAAAIAKVDPDARALLGFARLAGDWVGHDTLLSVLTPLGIMDPLAGKKSLYWRSGDDMGDPSASDSKDLRDVLARLEVQGLLVGASPRFGHGTVIDMGMARDYAIPADLRELLPAADAAALSRREAPAQWTPADPQPFARALYSLWSFVWRHEPALLKKGTIAKRGLKALAAEYPVPLDADSASTEVDLAQIYRHRWLLMHLGLIEHVQWKHLRADLSKAEDFWEAPLAERARRWHDSWLDAWWWCELNDIPGLTWRRSSGSAADELNQHMVRARKKAVAFVHLQLADGQWHAMDRLMALMELRDRDFLVPAYRSRSAYGYSWETRYNATYNHAGLSFPHVRDETQGWQQVETRYVEQLLRTLHGFGILDLAEADEGLEAVRLSALGRHVFAEGPTPPEPSGGRIILQPNFHILAFGPVPERDLLRLERFADRAATDRAMEFVLDAGSVYRAQRQGLGCAHVIAELRTLTEAEVPQNVLRSLEEWQESHEQIVVRRGVSLLHADDPELLAQLTTLPEAASAIRPLAPTFALAADGTALDALLEAADLIPVRRHDPTARGTVRLAEDGRVELRHKFADLYTAGRLDMLAEHDPQGGGWRLTAEAARAAKRKRGWLAETQIEAWRVLCADEGPAWLERRIKRWLGSYGKARLRRAWVLELDKPEALAALQEGPVGSQDDVSAETLTLPLRAYKPKGVPVLIDPDDLARLRTLLEAYGIELEE
jgi:hypothetical protein